MQDLRPTLRPLDRGRFAMRDEECEDIWLDGLKAPLRVGNPDVVLSLLEPILKAWPANSQPPKDATTPPFATLSPAGKKHWRLEAPSATNPVAHHNPVNAVCDLIVELSWERLRSRPELLCLHAAALKFGDRVVIFPNARRAGKSLLTATLARFGHDVFSDDFVPLNIDAETGVIASLANGIAPRLRLPLPDHNSTGLNDWIKDHIGPTNKQYGYLNGIDLPLSGTSAPVGAVVVLQRDPDLTEPASLVPIPQDEAMAALVTQNFGRQVHAGAILRVADTITRRLPVLRLRYNAVEEAAALLHASPALQDLPAVQMPESDHQAPLPLAPLEEQRTLGSVSIDLAGVYRKLPDHTEVETETCLYLADGLGISIHRLKPVSAIIWKLLDEQLSGEDMIDVMQEIYPDVPTAQLRDDTAKALKFFVMHRLIA